MRMIDVSREARVLLLQYEKFVIDWNASINLVGKKTINDFWNRHIIDSLQLIQFIKNKKIHLIDIGSGAGLPGIVLSIAGVKNVTLIEVNNKKYSFLLVASKLSNQKINILNDRIENQFFLDCDIITCRAFDTISNILNITCNIQVRDKYLLLKGKNYMKDIIDAQKKWWFDYIIYDSVSSSDGKIIEIKNVKCRTKS